MLSARSCLSELELSAWLLQQGVDVNQPSDLTRQAMAVGHRCSMLWCHFTCRYTSLKWAALLLSHGAGLQVRASISKPTVGDVGWVNLEQVTVVEYARNFIHPDLVNREALDLVARC